MLSTLLLRFAANIRPKNFIASAYGIKTIITLRYYALEVSYFKSSLDRKLLELLWNKYWVNTLSSSSLLTNADYTTGQVFDLSEKLEQSEAQLGQGSFMLGLETHDRKSEDKPAKAT